MNTPFLKTVSEYLKIGAIRRMFGMLRIRRTEVAILVAFAGLYAIFEGFGISMLLPVLQYVEQGPAAVQSARDSMVFGTLLRFTDALQIPITLLSLLVIAFIPILLRQVTYYLNAWYAAEVQNRAVVRMKVEGFRALMDAGSEFFARRNFGDLIALLTNQADTAGAAVLQFARLLSVFALLILYAAILLYLSPLLTGIAVGAVVLLSFVIRANVKRSRQFGIQLSLLGRRAYQAFAERIRLERLIKMTGQVEREARATEALVQDFADSTVRAATSQAVIEITVDPGLMLSAFAVIYVGVERLNLGLSALGVFLFVLLRLNQKAKEFNVGRQQLSVNLESLLYVHETIEQARRARTVSMGTLGFSGVRDAIRFEHVGFEHEDARRECFTGLVDIDVELRSGSLTAVVGPSGAGKSTLVDLIPRLRDATSGRITYDGHDVREFDLSSLRRGIGYMTQEAMLFDETVRSNITYGLDRDVPDEQLWDALSVAYVAELVRDLPQGLDEPIGDRGARLSGGERQRLCLARVVLQDPAVLILDEPTSALDPESERYIHRALEDLRGEKVVVVVAHRLSTVKMADQVLVLEGGHLVGVGTHEDLLLRSDTYRRLFEAELRD